MLHAACCMLHLMRSLLAANLAKQHCAHKPQASNQRLPWQSVERVGCLPAQLQLDCLPACWTCVSGLRLDRQTDRQTLQEVPHGWGSNGLSYRRTVEIIHSKYDRLALQQAINLVGRDSTRSILVSSVDCQITARVGAATTSMAPKCAETIKITFLGKRNPWHGCQKSRQCRARQTETDKSTNNARRRLLLLLLLLPGYTRTMWERGQAEVARKRFRYPQRHLGDLASTQLQFQFQFCICKAHCETLLESQQGDETFRDIIHHKWSADSGQKFKIAAHILRPHEGGVASGR